MFEARNAWRQDAIGCMVAAFRWEGPLAATCMQAISEARVGVGAESPLVIRTRLQDKVKASSRRLRTWSHRPGHGRSGSPVDLDDVERSSSWGPAWLGRARSRHSSRNVTPSLRTSVSRRASARGATTVCNGGRMRLLADRRSEGVSGRGAELASQPNCRRENGPGPPDSASQPRSGATTATTFGATTATTATTMRRNDAMTTTTTAAGPAATAQ